MGEEASSLDKDGRPSHLHSRGGMDGMEGGKPEAASGVVIVMAVVMEASAILAPEGGGYDGLRRRGR